MTITESQVQKIIATIRAGLRSGQGSQLPGDMCVEAAVCYGLNLPHGDDPGCVDPALRELKIMLNDMPFWISPESRARGMEALALVQLGSLGTIDTMLFVEKLAKMTVRIILPRALRKMASVAGNDRMINHAEKCERIGEAESLPAHHHLATSIAATFGETRFSSVAAAAATAVASVAILDIPASSVASAVAFKIADVVITAADSTSRAAKSAMLAKADLKAIGAMDLNEIADIYSRHTADAELHFFTGEVLKIAKEMNFPGCKWLPLLEGK